MNHQSDDRIFERNLEQLGRSIDLPEPPTQAQFRRWRGTAASDVVDVSLRDSHLPARSGPSRNPSSLLISRGLIGGALAASLVLIAWLSIERQQTVSAQTILAGFAESMTGAIWVEFDSIDLGSVILNGRIFWGKPDEIGIPREYYSETFLTMRPENPDWVDHKAGVVMCQTDNVSWRYRSGSGVSGWEQLPDGRFRMQSPPGKLDRDFRVHDMRKSFDTNWLFIPESAMGVGTGESQTRFHATPEQRDLIAQAILWMRVIHMNDHPPRIIERLNDIADETAITSVDRTTFELTARNLQFDAVEAYLHQTDASVVVEIDMTSSYDAVGDDLGWSRTQIHPSDLRLHRAIRQAEREILEALREADRSLDVVIAIYRQYTDDITVDESDDGSWKVTARNMRIHGRAPAMMHGEAPLPELLAGSTLIVRYDLSEQRVTGAEFRNIGGGTIRISSAAHGLDPELTNPDRWESDHR
jgi:hypothetical protein